MINGGQHKRVSAYVIPGIKTRSAQYVVDVLGAGTPDEIIAKVAIVWGVSPEDIKGRSRKSHNLLFARHTSAYLIRYKCLLGTDKTGRVLGNRDHSTITNSCKAFNKDWETSKFFRNKTLQLLDQAQHL